MDTCAQSVTALHVQRGGGVGGGASASRGMQKSGPRPNHGEPASRFQGRVDIGEHGRGLVHSIPNVQEPRIGPHLLEALPQAVPRLAEVEALHALLLAGRGPEGLEGVAGGARAEGQVRELSRGLALGKVPLREALGRLLRTVVLALALPGAGLSLAAPRRARCPGAADRIPSQEPLRDGGPDLFGEQREKLRRPSSTASTSPARTAGFSSAGRGSFASISKRPCAP